MSKNYAKLNMISEKNHRGLFSLILAALLSTSSYNAQAETFLWNNTGTNWTTDTSWTNGVHPQFTSTSSTTDEVQFGNVGANFNAVNMTSTRAVQNLTFLNNANAYTFGTPYSSLLQTRKGLTNNSTATQTFNLVVNNANGNNTWTQAAGGALVFNNTVNLNTATSTSSKTLTLTGGGTFTFNGSVNNRESADKVVVNAAGGTVNLNAANAIGAGFTVTAGTVNFSDAGALGTGTLELGNTSGALYGNSVLNNATGSAVTLGNSAVTWSGTRATGVGVQIGTAASTSANNIDFGNGLVTASSSRAMNIAGTGVTVSMGTLNSTTTASSATFTIDGVGNTLVLDGYNIRATTQTSNRVDTLDGTANLTITGVIQNGNSFSNGLNVKGTGVTTFSGDNTYTGSTTISAGTTILSGNNSGATGGLVLAGASGTENKPLVKLNNVNAISSSSTILGSSSVSKVGTLDFNAGTAYTLNSYSGGTMNFTNSFGQDSVVTFTNAANILTDSAGSNGGRTLQNNSANLDIVFNGSLDIGSSATDTVNTIGGAGDFVVKGNIFSTTAGSVRGLSKTGAGLLEMRGDNNNYNGNTTIFNGTISVTNGAVLTGTTVRVAPSSSNSGTLLVNGTAGAVVVSARGILAGGGTVGDVTLESGSFLKPGNSPGLLTASSSTWAAESTYNWEIDNATGTAGTNWDLFSVTGALDLAALSSGAQMNLVLESLSIANFSTSAEYSWVIAQAASFIGTGLENGTDVTSLFNISSANFNSGVGPNGGFKVEVGTDANNLRTLNLMAIPEPSTGSMLGLGLAGLVAARLLRRKSS